jgi:hypothetical protein
MNMIRLHSILAAFVLAPLFSASGAIPIYVNGGSFSAPYYRFYSDSSLTNELDIRAGGADALSITETYLFSGGSGFHPFYISDQAFNSPVSVVLDGAGSPASGITGFSQSFTLSFNGFNPESDTLTYYCTNHSDMNATFNVIPEPGTYALFGGVLALILVGLRRRFRG